MAREIYIMDMAEEHEYKGDRYCDYDSYTVYVGDHRILTIHTDSTKTTTKWLSDVSKSPSNNHKHGCLLVGVCAEHNPDYIHSYPDQKTIPYHLIQISLGSHCFLFRLPFPDNSSDHTPKALQTFFANPRVIAVGMKMKNVAKNLETAHGIKFANPVDLNELAVNGMKRSDLDLGSYDLDRLAKVVLGRHWDVERREEYLSWYIRKWNGHRWYYELREHKVETATLDPFYCFMIGNELLDMMDDNAWYPREFSKFLKMNKNYKKKKGKPKKNIF